MQLQTTQIYDSLPFWIGLCSGLGVGSAIGILLHWITFGTRNREGDQ